MSGRRFAGRTVGILLVAIAAVGFVARGRLGEVLLREGAPAAQRPLAGGTAGANPRIDRPLRVIVLDGLHRADVAAMPATEALCRGGLDLIVDVGFPTKSLPVQLTLWTGLTNQQLGARGDNLEVWSPPSAVPRLVPGSVAVVESHPEIARSVGFAQVLPAQGDRRGHFLGSALIAAGGDAPLVMVHVLEIDVAQHRDGRGSPAHRDALADADRVVAAVTAAAPPTPHQCPPGSRCATPAAQWLVIADHGHVAGGGHGDAEDAVRRVHACWSPPPAGVTAPPGTEVHLIDVARWLADALGAPRHAHAQGRTLAVAAAYPDRDATLPRPGALRIALALALFAAGVTIGLAASRGRVTALWPIAAAVVIIAVDGVPTLSHRASPIVLSVTGALLACIALVVERRAGDDVGGAPHVHLSGVNDRARSRPRRGDRTAPGARRRCRGPGPGLDRPARRRGPPPGRGDRRDGLVSGPAARSRRFAGVTCAHATPRKTLRTSSGARTTSSGERTGPSASRTFSRPHSGRPRPHSGPAASGGRTSAHRGLWKSARTPPVIHNLSAPNTRITKRMLPRCGVLWKTCWSTRRGRFRSGGVTRTCHASVRIDDTHGDIGSRRLTYTRH